MAPDIININIQAGDGLSYAIDRKLDEELKQDVRFNLSEWNSVFNVIKEDKATAKKQYTGGDSDITDSKQYIVQEGNYQITKNAWNKIVDIAKKKLGISTAAQEEATTQAQSQVKTLAASQAVVEEEKVKEQKTKNDEEIIKTFLTDAGISVSETDMEKIKSKYGMILTYNKQNGIETNEAQLKERIVNYAKGLRFQNFEKTALTGNSEYQSDCSEAKTLEELQSKYKQFGKEYVETMDQDGNGQIDAHEMFYTELTTLYEAQGMSYLQAKTKALDVVKKFKDYNAMNLPKEGDPLYGTEEAEQFTDILVKVGVLDEDKNMSLSTDEAAAYLMTMAQLDDTKNNITSNENIRTELVIATMDMSVQEIMDTLGVSEQAAENIISYREKFNNSLEMTQNFIKTGSLE